MTLPSVSIGIPTYNRSPFLARAIDSVLKQTYKRPVEIIVVDDGSTDDTLKMLEKYGEKIRLYPSYANYGIAYSKNHALLLGTGEIRGILDSDDAYEPEFVERCVDALLAGRPKVGLVYTDNHVVDARGNRIRTDAAIEWGMQAFLETCNVRGDCWLAWWSVLEQTRLHDENFELEVDYDLFYQTAEITVMKRVPQALHNVTEHGGRTSGAREKAAFWHAAGLAKYGHSIDYARRRAQAHNAEAAWGKAIEAGYAKGEELRKLKDLRLRWLRRPNRNRAGYWDRVWRREADRRELRGDRVMADHLLEWIPGDARVLDLACGDGALARVIRFERPWAKVTGVDFSPAVVELNNARDGAHYLVRDLNSDDGWEASYDIVMCVETIEHLRNPLRVLVAAQKTLKHGGLLLLTTPLATDVSDPEHVWAFMPHDVENMARLYGGRVLTMRKTGEHQRAVLYVIAFG